MKKMMILLVMVGALLASGCAKMGPDMVSWDVYSSTRDRIEARNDAIAAGYNTDEQAERLAQLKIEEQKKLQGMLNNAIEQADKGAIRNAQDLMKQINESSPVSPVNFRHLAIQNIAPDCVVEVLSEPFTGTTLSPGEKTRYKKPFLVGVYPLTFKWHKIGSNGNGTKTVNISIGRKRSDPIKIHY